MALDKIGVEAVIQGLNSYLSGMDKMGAATDRTGKQVGALGRVAEIAGGVLAASFVQRGLDAVLAAGPKIISAASDMSESINKVNVVFGSSATVIQQFATTAAKNLGLSKQQALEAAGTFGNLFVAMKIGQPQAAEMSKGILTLAADLASFNNIDPAIALDKLRAGLVGETEPLRTLGVNLTAAAVETQALAMGFTKVNGELTPAAKAQAAYALILQQTKTAQGDVTNTSAGMANAVRRIKATFADAVAEVGGKFLPLFEPMINNFSLWLPGAIDTAMAKLGELRLVFDGVVALFRDGDFTSGLREGIEKLTGMKIEEDSGIIIALLKIRDALIFLKDTALPEVLTWLNLVKVKVEGMGKAFDEATTFVKEHKEAQVALVGALSAVAGPLGVAGVTAIVTKAIGLFGGFTVAVKAAGVAILGFSGVALGFAGVGLLVGALATDFGGSFTTIIQLHEILALGMRKKWAQITGEWDMAKAEFEAFSGNMKTLGEDIGSTFERLGTWVRDNWATPMGNAIADVWHFMEQFAGDVGDLISGLVDTISRVVPQFLSIGGDIVQGLLDGITGAWGGLTSTVEGLWQSLPQGLRDFIEGNSPSLVFAEIGADIVAGLALGIITNKDQVQQSLQKLLDIDQLNADIDAMVRGGNFGGAIERLMFGGASADDAIAEVQSVHAAIREEMKRTATEQEEATERIMKAEEVAVEFARDAWAKAQAVVKEQAIADAKAAADELKEILQAQIDFYQKNVKPFADEARAVAMEIAKSVWRDRVNAQQEEFKQGSLDTPDPFAKARSAQERESAMNISNRRRADREVEDPLVRLKRGIADLAGFGVEDMARLLSYEIKQAVSSGSLISMPVTAGAGAGGSVVNYNVNANYTNPQTPQSIITDLQTIALLAGR